MADSDGERISKKGLETQIPLAKVILILVGTAAMVMVVGPIIGYSFFWNKYTQQTPVDAAFQSSLQAVKDKPADAASHLRLGYIYLVRGETEQAMQHYREAYSLSPDNPQIRYNLALGCIASNQYEEAIKLLKQLAQENNLSYDTHFSLGTAYLKASQYENSIKTFEQALIIRNGAADTYYYIGQACEGLGDRDKALASYDNALRLVPDYQAVLRAKSILTQTAVGGDY